MCLAGGCIQEGGVLGLLRVRDVPVPAERRYRRTPECTVHGRTIKWT